MMFNSYLKPMEPQTCSHAFDSDEHIFQVKWDGVRILAFVNKDQVRLQNRKLKDSKPSFSRILQRDLISITGGQSAKLTQIPITYMFLISFIVMD